MKPKTVLNVYQSRNNTAFFLLFFDLFLNVNLQMIKSISVIYTNSVI